MGISCNLGEAGRSCRKDDTGDPRRPTDTLPFCYAFHERTQLTTAIATNMHQREFLARVTLSVVAPVPI